MWGTATAAHQVEGNNTNSDSWVLENVPGTIYAEPSGDAIDHYHRYADDIAMLTKLGFNTYRFSIEWARIEPEEGQFSMAALEHYRRMLATCHENGIKPIVTFHHFTSPRWLMAHGAWASMETPDRFARYCEHTTRYLGDLISIACTLNEPNLGLMLSRLGFGKPFKQQIDEAWWLEAAKRLNCAPENLAPFTHADPEKSPAVFIKTHRKAYEAIKSVKNDIMLGLTLAIQDFQALPGGEAYTANENQIVNGQFLDTLRGDDFVGVQTYSRNRYDANGMVQPDVDAERTQMRYEFYPEALEATIRYAVAKTGCPVIVTENGIGTADDTRRIEYIKLALHGVANCLRDGLDVRGYTYWSAFDNFEWGLGYRPTFGIIAIDRSTQQRTPKPSAAYLAAIGRANEIVLEP